MCQVDLAAKSTHPPALAWRYWCMAQLQATLHAFLNSWFSGAITAKFVKFSLNFVACVRVSPVSSLSKVPLKFSNSLSSVIIFCGLEVCHICGRLQELYGVQDRSLRRPSSYNHVFKDTDSHQLFAHCKLYSFGCGGISVDRACSQL